MRPLKWQKMSVSTNKLSHFLWNMPQGDGAYYQGWKGEPYKKILRSYSWPANENIVRVYNYTILIMVNIPPLGRARIDAFYWCLDLEHIQSYIKMETLKGEPQHHPDD